MLTGLAALLTALVGVAGFVHGLNLLGSTGSGGVQQSPVTQPSPAVGVLSQGRASLGPDMQIDLVHGITGTNVPGADLTRVGDTDSFIEALQGFLAPASGTVSRQSCVAVLNSRHDIYEKLADLEVGSSVCLQGGGGRIGSFTVVSLPSAGDDQVVFTYLVWR